MIACVRSRDKQKGWLLILSHVRADGRVTVSPCLDFSSVSTSEAGGSAEALK
jgi:hypothetical protein